MRRLGDWHLTQNAILLKKMAKDGNNGKTQPHKNLVATPQSTIATQEGGGKDAGGATQGHT